MASTVHPSCFRRCESIVTSAESLPTNNEKSIGCRTWNQYGFIKLKFWSTSRDSRTIQLTKSHINCSRLDSNSSDLASGWKEENASVSGADNAICFEAKQKIEPVNGWNIDVGKHWRQVGVMAVSAGLACTFFIMPPAYVVDAFNTCSCLLKECRLERWRIKLVWISVIRSSTWRKSIIRLRLHQLRQHRTGRIPRHFMGGPMGHPTPTKLGGVSH